MSLKNKYANRQAQMPTAQGSEVVSVNLEYDLAAALVLNDIIKVGYLPAGHVPVDAILHSDDLDTNGTPAIVMEMGLLNDGETDIDDTYSGGAPWKTGSTIGQAGGIDRADNKSITRVTPSDTTERAVGIHVSTAPATGAAAGKVGIVLSYRAANYGG